MSTNEEKKQLTPSQSSAPTQTTKQGLMGVETQQSGSTASEMVAAQAKAEVEAGYALANLNPRNEDKARLSIIHSCRNYRFADKSIYKKPVGKKQINGKWTQQFIEGPSIRFAEEVIRNWGNIRIFQPVIHDDPERRIVRVICMDLQSNAVYAEDIIIEKTVERKNGKFREVIYERVNSNDEVIFIVRATEDEIRNKEKALVSKAIRNNGLRLVPSFIIEEAMDMARETLTSQINEDPEALKKKILDCFFKLGIDPEQIEEYLECPLKQATATQLQSLQQVYTSIKDGESKWSDYTDKDEKPVQEKTAVADVSGMKPGDPKEHQAVDEDHSDEWTKKHKAQQKAEMDAANAKGKK